MSEEPQASRVASVMHVRCPMGLPEPVFRQVMELLCDVSPVVQVIPPRAALVELRGALRFFGTGPRQIAEVVRLRSIALLGVDLRIGTGASWAVAATASGQVPEPGGVLSVATEETESFLAPLPIEALHGIGARQAAALRGYGLYTVGALAAVPAATVQRILGGRAGRAASDRARGWDPRPVTPRALPASASVRRRFTQQVLDGAPVRASLLELVVRLGDLLRRRDQAARAVTLQLTFASGAAPWEKTRRLREPSAHDEDLRTAAYQLLDAAGLQRARLVGMALRGEDLLASDQVAEQISLDRVREARLRAEVAVDRANMRFGAGTVGPAALLGKAS
ncbi:DNA polymerase Y family protein [Streptomyces marianii]|uniref:UmuC domain-containing protein n=1 Tax=Streptomyces marianii TaxID=1817406 RepID=A0A5R9DRE4_9ACTN|nr:hypothetical protein [Streptomyces marianii]TLQ38968.1 hypothetical protein FEF34_39820 [Streptomyces marianii]